MTSIGFYGSHNSAFAIEKDGEVLCVLEIERFCNYKNAGIAQYKTVKDIHITMELVLNWIEKTYGIKEFDTCIINTVTVHMDRPYDLQLMIPHKEVKRVTHHYAHAAGAFYQTDFQEALIFSFDGGGDDGKFNIFLANREEGPTRIKNVINPELMNDHLGYDLGFTYATFGEFLGDIKKEPLSDGNLVYPGKIMGLASYGTVHEDWLEYFMHYYKSNAQSGEYEEEIQKRIGDKIGVIFDINNRFTDQIAYDIAATSQRAFEECFLEVAKPYLEEYPDLPVGITGGCGLNIILNTRIKQEFNREVFVGPNPNDCGLASGLLLSHMKPKKAVDLTYKGIPLLDIDALPYYFENHHIRKIVKEYDESWYQPYQMLYSDVVTELVEGKIFGIVRGNSEHGPRALGNRSIICNPTFPEMKDILNTKVKHREWYRPFAPVVRLEDVSKYFEFTGESRWMSFCPKVRDEWKEKLSAITHVDGTARVQTITREQNEWLYDLITAFEKETGIGVLLNTSFNVDGRPILSTIKDAVHIFDSSQLDRLIIEDYHFRKWQQ